MCRAAVTLAVNTAVVVAVTAACVKQKQSDDRVQRECRGSCRRAYEQHHCAASRELDSQYHSSSSSTVSIIPAASVLQQQPY